MTTPDDAALRPRPLAGCRVLVTRERPGELGRLLTEAGAAVVHVPLIAAADPPDGGAALQAALADVDTYDWVIVTSPVGAERVGRHLVAHPDVATAAVGTATARRLAELCGREVDLVPGRQLAAALVGEFTARNGSPRRVLVAQADRAATTLADGLRDAGHDVDVVIAYSTVLVVPDPTAVADADVLALASGSAAQAWVDALGEQRPPIVVAIGPSTADRARELGLKVDGVAADHSLGGLVGEIVAQVTHRPMRDLP